MARTTEQAQKAKANIEKDLAKFQGLLDKHAGNAIYTERVNTLTARLQAVNLELAE